MTPNRRGSTNKAQRTHVASMPAPIGGWNQRDSLASMPKTDAVILDNWFPTPYDVGVRSGCIAWATGMAGNVETLAPYSSGSASKLFAVASGSIYDASANSAVGAALVTGLSNSRFQTANIGTAGGQFLAMVNGTDPMQLYNGTGWASIGNGVGAVIASGSAVGSVCTLTTATAHKLAVGMAVIVSGCTPAAYNGTFTVNAVTSTGITYTASAAPGGVITTIGAYAYTPAVTGVSTSLWSNVLLHKQRLWFVERNSLRGWYLPTSSVGGTAVQFDFSSLFRQGGYITTMAVWTLDAGYGIDDMLVIITSKGEAAVYRGTDPSTVATWAMVGLFVIGAPMSARCATKFAGDCLIINRDGLVPLSSALQSSRIEVAEALSDKIQWAISTATTNYAGNFGWESIVFPTENMLLLNVPLSSSVSQQYVMNTVSKAWCRFLGWNACTFSLFNDMLYFGAAGTVYQAFVGQSDNGAGINAEALQAYSYFGTTSRLKKFNMVRPMLAWDNRPALTIGIACDFSTTAPSGSLTANSLPTTTWGSALAKWGDAGTLWMGGPSYQTGWQTAYGLGYCAGLHIVTVTTTQQLRWASTDYSFEVGSVL